MRTLLPLIVLLAGLMCAEGKILVYKLTQSGSQIGNGFKTSLLGTGYVAVDLDTHDLYSIVTYTIGKAKYVMSRTHTCSWDEALASGNRYYTTITEEPNDRFPNHVYAYGQNSTVAVDVEKHTVSAPLTMTGRIYAIDPGMVFDTAITLTFDSTRTKSANKAGTTAEGYISDLLSSYQAKGYIEQ